MEGGLLAGCVVTVMLATPSARAWTASRLPDVTLSGAGQMNAQVDLNRDGRLDLISGRSGEQQRGVIEVRYGTGTGFKQKPDFRYEGQAPSTFLGTSPLALDVNGDGWPDLVVGAYGYSGKLPFSGALLVFFGGPNGFPAQPSQVIEGPESGSFFGFKARSLGDFNQDGYADLAVSASTGNGTQGTIFVYAGSPTGLILRPESTLAFPKLAWSVFGRNFDTGNLHGDGSFSIVVGAVASEGLGVQPRPGRVYVYRGSRGGYVNTPTEVIEAPGNLPATAAYASSIAVLGDVDGDGQGELAVAAPTFQPAGSGSTANSSGRLYVYFGSATGFKASGRQQIVEPSATDGFGYFGEVMLGQRDFNGDGHADLIVGSSQRQRGLDASGPFPGLLWIYTGGPGGFDKPPFKRSGVPGSQDGLGALIEAADVSGDGQMDILTGNPLTPADPQGITRVFRGAKGLK